MFKETFINHKTTVRVGGLVAKSRIGLVTIMIKSYAIVLVQVLPKK